MYRMCCFFFFQAEDGIRDLYVTGVQTCALPIFAVPRGVNRMSDAVTPRGTATAGVARPMRASRSSSGRMGLLLSGRSEERRVGKECRERVEDAGDVGTRKRTEETE